MRDLLILSGIGILTAAAWTVTAGEGAAGHGAMHAAPGHGGLVGHMRHGESHKEQMGIFFPIAAANHFMDQLPGEPGPAPAHPGTPTGDVVVAGAEHMIRGHLVSVAIHPLEHVSARAERGKAVIPQPASAGAADFDQDGAATAQPNPPTAKPSPPRPPGASA
jgi:hypothetical protein